MPARSNGPANSVIEGAANGSTVGITVAAADPHGGAVTYLLTDDAGGRFTIDGSTGVVTVANASLINTEDGGSYTIKVAAKDASNAASADATFTISVTNVAPSTPTDANGATNVVAENVANGATVGITASAADPHGGAVTYSLSDNAGGRFAIDSSTGVVTVANASLINTEDGGSYTIKVAAKDSSNAASADATFTIGVTNVAPSTPTDSDAAANVVSENAANGTVVHVTAQSADPHGGSVAYTLTDNAGGRFAINASTGIVTVANGSLLDFEAQTSHTITVRAGDTNGGQSTTQTFTIGVLNVAGNTINGSGGADTINGTHGPNGPQAPVGFATNEDDTIHGKAGNDTIHGLGGNDRLFGDAGNDKLFGDNGNDRLDGGVGTDQLSGGANIDTFVFRHGYGHDTVVDYVAGTDKIDLSGTGAHGFGGIHLVKHGANVDIHVGSDILTLAHTTIATINAHHGDFIFA
jgi:Ca2+-binding RTX toxin-like protein